MALSSDALLDHIVDYLQFISNAQSFWFTLITSMTMAATLPVDFIWTQKTLRLCWLLPHCPGVVAPPSCQLVVPACCCIASPCPLVAPRAALSSSCCAGWLLRRLSMRRPLVVLLSHRATSCCLVAPAGCCTIISCRPLVAPPSHTLIVLAGCCIACPCAALSSRCQTLTPTITTRHC